MKNCTKKTTNNEQKGIVHIAILGLVVAVLAGSVFAGWRIYRARNIDVSAQGYPTSCNGISGTSGCIPQSQLCRVSQTKYRGAMMRCDAVPRFIAMANEFERVFKKPLTSSSQGGNVYALAGADGGDFYRSLERQIECYKRNTNCAFPGRSNHGLGVAVDLGSNVNVFRSWENRWLWDNRCRWGFYNPSITNDYKLVRPQGWTAAEPWHWEFDYSKACATK